MRKIVLLLGTLLVAGCSDEPTTAATAGTVSEPCPTTGEVAYLRYCARCHDAGMDGAPIVGNRADWADRPKLWQAVAMEHAKDGYLNMPARGGNADIDDKTIEAAAEYMLEATYSNLPPD